jgi:aminoglycoside 2'-N-acetyltransferase I
VGDAHLRRIATAELTATEIEAIRAVLWAAFGDDPEEAMTEHDWQHALGGTHVVAEADGRIVAHASVVSRELHVAGTPLRTGYVEAVAVEPGRQGSGIGTVVMREVAAIVGPYEVGALGTAQHHFYERLGWRTWRGPSSVRTTSGDRPTPDEDGYIMVLTTEGSPTLDFDAPISCDWRPGDVW